MNYAISSFYSHKLISYTEAHLPLLFIATTTDLVYIFQSRSRMTSWFTKFCLFQFFERLEVLSSLAIPAAPRTPSQKGNGLRTFELALRRSWKKYVLVQFWQNLRNLHMFMLYVRRILQYINLYDFFHYFGKQKSLEDARFFKLCSIIEK